MTVDAAAPELATTPLSSEVARRATFDQVRYAQSWEDPESLRSALQPTAESTILSIAAAGDNSFALLLQGASRVVSVDLSPAQCALVELKRAALLTLEHRDLLAFVGVAPSRERGALYARCRPLLPEDARAFWDANPLLISRGIIHVGKLEGMWRTFRTRVLPLLHGSRTVQAAFEPRSRLQRERFWHERWNNRRWRTIVRAFFSEPVIARLGRDRSFFEYVDIDVGAHYARRAYHAFVELDPSQNPFLQYIMLGRSVSLDVMHPYLTREGQEQLRDRLDRLEVRCMELEQLLDETAPGTFTGFNLSDVFEWMSDDLHEQVYRAIVRTAAPGARIAYWNNLVERAAPASLLAAGVVRSHPELSRRIHDADRSFLYRGFHVDEVIGTEVQR